MSLRRVTISFKDAGLFQRPPKAGTEQVMLTPSGLVNREKDKSYADAPANTLLRACVANMFRVLLGYRPMPTFRGATEPHKEDSECPLAVDLAKRCFVNIETGIAVTNAGEEYHIREMQMTNKYASKIGTSSWGKSSITWAGPEPLTYRVSWHTVESEFSQEAFAEFKKIIIDMLGESAPNTDMVSIFSALYKADDKSKLKTFFAKNQVSKSYEDTLLYGKTSGQYFGYSGTHQGLKHWYYYLVIRGINQVSRRSGTIIMDVTEDEAEKLMSGPTMATLLDGGFAEITSIDPSSSDDIPGVHTFDHEEI